METIKSDIKVYDPVNTNNGIYYSKLLYKESEISIQIPKNTLKINKEKNKAKIIIDDEACSFIKAISEAVINITSERSEDFFGKVISVEDCKSIYKEALVENLLHCFFDEDTYFYESKNNKIEIEDLPSEVDGIALLKCTAIVYTKYYFFIKWDICQFKIKKQKHKEEMFKLDEYIIKDMPEHELPLDNKTLIDKLDEISLF